MYIYVAQYLYELMTLINGRSFIRTVFLASTLKCANLEYEPDLLPTQMTVRLFVLHPAFDSHSHGAFEADVRVAAVHKHTVRQLSQT